MAMISSLLPALMPSWRFFDRIGPAPRIQYAFVHAADRSSPEWRDLRPRPARLRLSAMLGRLFWNPDGNEALYLVSCAERLLDSPSALHANHLCARVSERVRRNHSAPIGPGTSLCVRIIETRREGDRLLDEVRFVSEPRGLSATGEAPTR